MKKTFALFACLAPAIALTTPRDLGKGQLFDHLHVHHAPDPVNVRTGNFYLPLQDYYKPCFNLPIEIYRSYNSFWTRTSSFGKGWTFNYETQVSVNDQVGLQVTEPDGFITTYQPKETAGGAGLIDKLVAAKKADDQTRASSKGTEFYQDYKTKLSTDAEFLKKQKNLLLAKESALSPSGKYVSKERGHSTLEETSGQYIRTLETGRKEFFSKKGKLTRIEDRNGNFLLFTYDGEKLAKISDGCEQSVSLKFTRLGQIEKITGSDGQSASYTYDAGSKLTSVKTVDNQTILFKYDDTDKMSAIVFPDASETKIVYEPKTNRVVKQIGPGTKITTYTYGKDSSKVWTLVEDTQGEKSKFEYLDAENKSIHTDRSGKKTITTHMACCGKPLSVTDEAGQGDTFKYDDNGNLISKTNALKQTTTFKYDERFGMPSEITDQTGRSIRYVFDPKGNMTFSKASTGEYVKLTYESHGKITSIIDQLDNEIVFNYDKTGNPIVIEKLVKKRKTAKLAITYSKAGEILNVTPEPSGKETVATIKSTISSLFDYLKPIGIEFTL